MSDTRSRKNSNWYWSHLSGGDVKEKSTANKNTKTIDFKVKNQAPGIGKSNDHTVGLNAKSTATDANKATKIVDAKTKNQKPAPVSVKHSNGNSRNKFKNQQKKSRKDSSVSNIYLCLRSKHA